MAETKDPHLRYYIYTDAEKLLEELAELIKFYYLCYLSYQKTVSDRETLF